MVNEAFKHVNFQRNWRTDNITIGKKILQENQTYIYWIYGIEITSIFLC